MPFVENTAQEEVTKARITRIVTDATVKDALQVSVDVINGGHKTKEFLIGIMNCPLSQYEVAKTTVKKLLMPNIGESIVFLLPFIKKTKQNSKFDCYAVVKTELKLNPSKQKKLPKQNPKIILVAKRSFSVEAHARCFCVWNCRCHCIGKIANPDLNICQRMSSAEEREAGLSSSNPNEEANDLKGVDDCDVDKESVKTNYVMQEIITIIIFLFIILLVMIVVFCKCCKPREEDLLAASKEWICSPKIINNYDVLDNNKRFEAACFCSSKNSKTPDKNKSSSSKDKSRKKVKQVDSLESALISLTRQQNQLRIEAKK